MRRLSRVLIVLLVGLSGFAATASGQSLSQPVIGIFVDHNDVFKGTIQERSLAGDTQILIRGQDTGLICTVFFRPTSTAQNEYDCEGLEGECFGTCDDGRRFQGSWKAVSCSAVVANATDQNGNRVTFFSGDRYAASQAIETPKETALRKTGPSCSDVDRCSLDR
jgi:hypothetical protein